METFDFDTGNKLIWTWSPILGVPDWTCERCWHAIAIWKCDTTGRYHCDKCKERLEK